MASLATPQDHARAKENKVSRTCELDHPESESRSCQNRRDAGRGRNDMNEAAQKGTEAGEDAFAPAPGQASRQHIQQARSGRNGQ
jgi:hypothetical protein